MIPGTVHSLSVSPPLSFGGGWRGTSLYFVARNILLSLLSSCPTPSAHMFIFFLTFVQYVRSLLHRRLSNRCITCSKQFDKLCYCNLDKSNKSMAQLHVWEAGCRIHLCTGSFIIIIAIAHQRILFWGQLNPVHTLTHCPSKISFIKLLPSNTCLFLPSGSFHFNFSYKYRHTSEISQVWFQITTIKRICQ